ISVVATLLVRFASIHNVPLAVIANAMGAFVSCLYVPTLMTAMYNLAKRAPCPLRFHFACEGGWDVGGAGAALLIAGVLALGVPLRDALLLALPGAFASLFLLKRYYGNRR